MSSLVYAIIPRPARWPSALGASTIHKHAADNGVRKLLGGRILIELRRAAVDDGSGVALPDRLLEHIPAALMSHGRALAVLYGEHLYADFTVGSPLGDPDSELTAKATSEGVDLSGMTRKRDIVRTLMRAMYPGLATPKLSAVQARRWADDKTGAQLRAWSASRGLYVGHAPSKAKAIEWLLTAEGYQA